MDPETGEMMPLEKGYTAVGALLPQGYTRLCLPGYVKSDKEYKLPLFGYSAVVWKDGGFYTTARMSDDPEKWNPVNCDLGDLELGVKTLKEKYPENRLYEHLSNCIGIQPNVIVCRTEYELSTEMKAKIALFCDIDPNEVVECRDASSLYEVPLNLRDEGLDEIVVNHLKLTTPAPDMSEWEALVERVSKLEKTVEIAIVGKYVALHDAYLSVVESLSHAGFDANADVKIRWVNAEELTADNVGEMLNGIGGILVPGGFGDRGIEGKISAIRYAREQNIPFFGICLGMQVSVILALDGLSGRVAWAYDLYVFGELSGHFSISLTIREAHE